MTVPSDDAKYDTETNAPFSRRTGVFTVVWTSEATLAKSKTCAVSPASAMAGEAQTCGGTKQFEIKRDEEGKQLAELEWLRKGHCSTDKYRNMHTRLSKVSILMNGV